MVDKKISTVYGTNPRSPFDGTEILALDVGGSIGAGLASVLAAYVLATPTITGHPTVEGVTSTGATGTGKFVFDGSPTLVTPVLGVATATSINKVALTAPATSATLTIPDGVTLTGPAASGTAMTLGNAEAVSGIKTFATGQIVNGTLRLGTVSSATGQLLLANSASANPTTIQAGNAAAARTYTWPTDFGAAGTVLTDAAGNGTLSWAAGGGGAGLGANTFTALQTITQGTANNGILASTGYSLTGSDATNMLDFAGTWNTSGNPTALKINITNTASGTTSLLMDLQASSVSQARFTKAGNLAILGGITVGDDSLSSGIPQAGMSQTSNGLQFTSRAAVTTITAFLRDDIFILRAACALQWGNTSSLAAAGQISANLGSIIIGTAAIATNATDGFLYIPTCAGTPTGTPTSSTGRIPMIYDTSNHQFWFYDSGWKQPKTPAGAALVTWQ